ncbi:unnamed protein product, partial [Polarella glacialis]
VDSFWVMIFRYRFVHGDLHPGNVLWRRRPGTKSHGGAVQLVLLDCGLVIDLTGEAGDDLSMMVKALLTKREEEVGRLLITLSQRVGGRIEDVVDPEGFVQGIAKLIRDGRGVNFRLAKLNAGALMGRSLLLGRRHCVRFDARFVNLMVAMVVVQDDTLPLQRGCSRLKSPWGLIVFVCFPCCGGQQLGLMLLLLLLLLLFCCCWCCCCC